MRRLMIVSLLSVFSFGCATDFHFSNSIYQGKNDPRHELYANHGSNDVNHSPEINSKPSINSTDVVPDAQPSQKTFYGMK